MCMVALQARPEPGQAYDDAPVTVLSPCCFVEGLSSTALTHGRLCRCGLRSLLHCQPSQKFPTYTASQVNNAMVAAASSGVVVNPGPGSPNRLLRIVSSVCTCNDQNAATLGECRLYHEACAIPSWVVPVRLQPECAWCAACPCAWPTRYVLVNWSLRAHSDPVQRRRGLCW